MALNAISFLVESGCFTQVLLYLLLIFGKDYSNLTSLYNWCIFG